MMRWIKLQASRIAFCIGVGVLLTLCLFLSQRRLGRVADRMDDVGRVLFTDDWV